MNTGSTDLSVIIVPYNNKDLLKTTLDSIFETQSRYSYEVIVHDNGSADGTVDMVETQYPQVKLIRGENIGFSKANNRGIAASSGRYILLLNPDTKIQANTLQVMLEFMDKRLDVGMATCKVVLANGKLDPACRRSFPTPWVAITRLSGLSLMLPNSKLFNKYNLSFLPEDEEYEIDSCSGAFLLTRRNVIDKIGLLDEDFFLYNEDLDWCYRAKDAGYKVYYCPAAQITHYKRQSTQFSKIAQWEFHHSMILFYRKHFSDKYPWIVNQIAYLGPYVRYYLKLGFSHFDNFFARLFGKKTRQRF